MTLRGLKALKSPTLRLPRLPVILARPPQLRWVIFWSALAIASADCTAAMLPIFDHWWNHCGGRFWVGLSGLAAFYFEWADARETSQLHHFMAALVQRAEEHQREKDAEATVLAAKRPDTHLVAKALERKEIGL